MLRVFEVYNGKNIEIQPINGVYSVVELGKYEIHYSSENIIPSNIFLEDLPIDSLRIRYEESLIILSEFRYFENYFGYASLSVNSDLYLFNIKIEKLKLSEIEDIFSYLWKKEDKLLNIFFSKSTYELDFKKKGFELGQTSKLLSFLETFITTFDKLYFSFENLPHTVLRKFQKRTNYDSQKVTLDTIYSILHNLDDINFDDSFKGHFNSIKINNKYGLIDKIDTTENKDSLDNYENQIILGAFVIILKKLSQLKKEISSNIDIRSESKSVYADFKDLKRIPFIRLFENSTSLEKKTVRLFNRYQKLFFNVTPRMDKPILTSVFAKKLQYKKAFELIKSLNDYRFDLFGEFKLLNITKLSKLYEVYNLYMIIDSLKNKLKIEQFNVSATSDRIDEIVEHLSFENEDYLINFFYEHKFYGAIILNQPTILRRIDTRKGSHYNPDFIFEILNKKEKRVRYYIMDAKYSKQPTVRNVHLPDLINKYILNTGLADKPSFKISSLNLIFPGESGMRIIDSDYFEPTIGLIASKPNVESELDEYIELILNNNLPSSLMRK